MADQAEEQGPVRLTGEAAYNAAKQAIAARNDAVKKAGRKIRVAKEQEKAATKRRNMDKL